MNGEWQGQTIWEARGASRRHPSPRDARLSPRAVELGGRLGQILHRVEEQGWRPCRAGFQDRLAYWAGVESGDLAMALLNEYPPGAPIGWHRDAPQCGIVAGVSLLSACRMRLRPYVPPQQQGAAPRSRRTATHEIVLERRSAYVMTGSARSAYEHHIPAVTSLRYSITFRTLRHTRE